MSGIQYFKLADQHLDRSGVQIGVHHAIGTRIHPAPHGQNVFIADGMGFGMHVRVNPGIEDDLGDALAVPQIYKYHAAVIPATQNPTHQYHFISDIFGAEFATAVCPAHIS